jgi:mRNA-degrading endonuclease YafQ of YafQ-DinJ toxin-antitoxin module
MNYKFLRKYTSKEVGKEGEIDDFLRRKKRKDAVEEDIVKNVQDHFICSASFVPDNRAVSKKTLESKKVLNEPLTTVYKNEPLITVYKNEPLTTVYKNEPLTTVYKNEPLTTVYKNEPLTTLYKNEPLITVYKNEPLTSL